MQNEYSHTSQSKLYTPLPNVYQFHRLLKDLSRLSLRPAFTISLCSEPLPTRALLFRTVSILQRSHCKEKPMKHNKDLTVDAMSALVRSVLKGVQGIGAF